MGDDKSDQHHAAAEPVTPATVLAELQRHEKAEKKLVNLQTVVILLGIVGTVLGGFRVLVISAWAQAKDHADAGVAIVRAEFEAHKAEEATARRRMESQVDNLMIEMRESRKEQRAIYDYMKTGREQPSLERPLPPLDGGR